MTSPRTVALGRPWQLEDLHDLAHGEATLSFPDEARARVEAAHAFVAELTADYACTGGKRCIHGWACSSWAAILSRRSSRPYAGIRCTPTGNPSALQCMGSEIPG